jgi:hypothetical protein
MLNTFVESSNIDRVGYQYGKLFIQFKSGISYVYAGVDKSMYDAMISAESAGKFFHRFIRSVYRYEKLAYDPFLKMAA